MALNGAYEHKKTRRLARALQCHDYEALGLLEVFWGWCRKSARTGRIDADQWDDIADYLHWKKPSEELRRLLVSERFLDQMDGWDWVHDWHHHADNTTRIYLDRRGEKFANGAPARIPGLGYFKNVETNTGNVETKRQNVELPVRAQPEPEPEPEPEPAATRATPARPPLPNPPPLSTEKYGHPEFEAYREALHSIMAKGVDPPDDAMVARIIFAAKGAPVEALAERFRQFAKTRHGPPKSYGFWPDVVADWFKGARKSGKRNHS